jgi:hypothetical protein
LHCDWPADVTVVRLVRDPDFFGNGDRLALHTAGP